MSRQTLRSSLRGLQGLSSSSGSSSFHSAVRRMAKSGAGSAKLAFAEAAGFEQSTRAACHPLFRAAAAGVQVPFPPASAMQNAASVVTMMTLSPAQIGLVDEEEDDGTDDDGLTGNKRKRTRTRDIQDNMKFKIRKR